MCIRDRVGSTSSPGRSSTPLHQGAAGRSVSHSRHIVEERMHSPGHAALEPALNSDSDMAMEPMPQQLWVDPRPHSPDRAGASPLSPPSGGRRRRGSDVSPKPTEVPLENALYALDQIHDTAHIVKRAIEARSRTSLW